VHYTKSPIPCRRSGRFLPNSKLMPRLTGQMSSADRWQFA
jgi:hypothetical protein